MLGKLLQGRRGMLVGAVRGTEWSQFLDYVTPSFFDVVGVRDLLSQGQEMAANLANGRGFRELQGAHTRTLAAREIPVRIGVSPGEAGSPDDPRALGQRILEVYFAQLFAGDTAILDLRADGWAWPSGEEAPSWRPRALWVRWEPGFLDAVRDLYRGFYQEDDARFEEGLRALRLEPAGEVLRAHFGEGDQRAVRFESRVFHSSFHEVFLRCRDEGVSLHRNFLALGLYLACLYDGLEELGPLDVRDAFERATA
ncbi:MAG: hypothetical protein QNK04_07440 [Myxococcota bacterium]|nr:hypothetical protein [Myxococcota bacterium]